MRLKKPYIATLNQVRISREGECGVIEYVEPDVWRTHLQIGPEVAIMADQEILDRHNHNLRIQEKLLLEYENVAIEIPEGHPQIKYSKASGQWTPRGDVLRCVIDDRGPDREAIIHIDDHELSLVDFGRLLTTYAGWGMRITFVPEELVHEEPRIVIREPDDD
ncbi:MAG: hypothetical protein IBX68_06090 [Dehalococcoidia bacterium]|nr:hypothetical protein [Dehalococcoidia bacterium]